MRRKMSLTCWTETPMSDTPATCDAWFDVHMRGQIISDLYKDDLRCAYAQGRAAGRDPAGGAS